MTFLSNLVFADYPRPWQVSFQKPATTMMEGIIDLHHDIFTFLVIILVFVTFMIGTILVRYQASFVSKESRIPVMQYYNAHGVTHNTVLEIVWTIVPTLILLLIATPSFALIYALDEIVEPELTLRVVGRQWYWTYEFPDQVSFGVPLTEEINQAYVSSLVSSLETKRISSVSLTNEINEALLSIFSEHRPSSEITFTKADLADLQGTLVDWTEEDFVSLQSKVDGHRISDFEFGHQLGGNSQIVIADAIAAIVHTDDVKELLAVQSHLQLNIPGFSINSYIVATEDLFPGSFRLLEADRRLVLPFGTNIRVLVTSYDVIHSWTVPSFGIKVDALPGRLNEYYLNLNYLGLFYGQCSEICGVNHGFMPIKVEVTTEDQFRWWFLQTSLLENNPVKFRALFSLEETLTGNLKNSVGFLAEKAAFLDFLKSFLLKR